MSGAMLKRWIARFELPEFIEVHAVVEQHGSNVFSFEQSQYIWWVSTRQFLAAVVLIKKRKCPAPGGYSIYSWVGRCGAAPHTLTLFKTNIADFPTLFKTEFRFLIPCLRHLTRNHTLCKTIIDIETLSYLIDWQSQHCLQLDQQSNEELFTVSIRSLH